MNDELLRVDDLHYRYPEEGPSSSKWGEALKGVSLSLRRGERLAVLGANGAGKSTFLLQLNGTLRPDSGRLFLHGRPYDYSRAGLRALRSAVALVFQDPDDQLFAGTVSQDVSFGPLNLGLEEETVRRRVAEALAAMNLTALAERPPHHLSHGQRKRAAIAGALAMNPEVLVLDEPTSGLDYRGLRALSEHLTLLGDRGLAIVLSTHDIDFAYEWASRVIVLNEGRKTADGEPTGVFADGALLELAGLRRPLRPASSVSGTSGISPEA